MDWNSSALWGIIGLVGGIIISTFFYFLGIKRKSLIYNIITTTLVSKNATQIEGLNIEYNNKPIKNLYTSTIIIKNNSNSIIEPCDFAPSAPLSLITDGEFFTTDTNESNFNNVHPVFKTNENNPCIEVLIHFDYISKKETVFCTVFHTGIIDVWGKLKDGKITNDNIVKSTSLYFNIVLVIILVILIIVMFTIFFVYNIL